MTRKLHFIIIVLLTSCFHSAFGQKDSVLADRFVQITPTPVEGRLNRTVQGKIVRVYTTGGYIALTVDPDLTMFSYRLNNRDYNLKLFKGSPRSIDDTITSPNSRFIYLAPGTGFTFDMLEAGKLVNRYIVNRSKLVPEIKFYRSGDNDAFFILPTSGREEKLSMKPGELDIRITDRLDFKHLPVEYILRNQKTGQWKSGNSAYNFRVQLEPNTVYELRYNYGDQKESMRVYTLYVKPYWYKSRKTYIILANVLVAIGFVWLMLFFKNKLKTSKSKQQKLEQAAIRLQSLLNPHFTFNALSSIQGLMNTGRIEEANQYLEEFSSLLRKTLAKNDHVFNNLDQELEMMRMYLGLEALRFNFTWDIEVSPDLDLSAIEIPTSILQPLVENAIKHGLSRLGDQGKLLIVCRQGQEKNTFVIAVKDNGTWVDQATESGYGLSLTAERITTINQIRKGQTIVLDFDKHWGTTAILTFNNWIDN